jgi:hypothetical protein
VTTSPKNTDVEAGNPLATLSDREFATLLSLMDGADEGSHASEGVSTERTGYQTKVVIIAITALLVGLGGVVLAFPKDLPRIMQPPASLEDPTEESSMKFRSAAVALVAASTTNAETLLVPEQFKTIQLAIDGAAHGDVILVSPGVYHEQVNLQGKAIELVGINGPGATVLDGSGKHTVIIGNGEPEGCVVRGFTIRNGLDVGPYSGGGVRLSQSSAHFSNCRFIGNVSESSPWGAGAWRSEYGAPRISKCEFIGNVGGYRTASVYHYLGGQIHISNCRFDGNVSTEGIQIHIQTEGGQISASIDDCLFRDCRTSSANPKSFSIIDFWNPFGGSISCLITACQMEGTPQTPATLSSAILLGSYSNSTYNVTIQDSTACGVPTLVRVDSNSSWIDGGGNSSTETCGAPSVCIGDIDANGVIDGVDLGTVLASWGEATAGTPADLNGDGTVDGSDLGALLANWGTCTL